MKARCKVTSLVAVALAAGLAACADIPRDPERTEALVRESGTIRLGVASGTPREPAAEAVLAGLQRATGARTEASGGDSEALMRDLEEGKIDLVYGRFAMDSPWGTKIHLGKALGWRTEPPTHVAAPRFAYRNGENGWIMRVETLAMESAAR